MFSGSALVFDLMLARVEVFTVKWTSIGCREQNKDSACVAVAAVDYQTTLHAPNHRIKDWRLLVLENYQLIQLKQGRRQVHLKLV